MLLGYGGYGLTFAITGQSGSGAAFLTSSAALADGRTGSGTALQWTNGTQSTASYVEITATITNPFGESSPRKGVASIINVNGGAANLYNLKTVIGGVTQRLRYGPRGELCAWAFPFANGATCQFRMYNDDGSSGSPIVAAQTIGLGEIFVGRLISLCTLAKGGPNPSRAVQDPTAFQRSSGGQIWELMRKPWWQTAQQLGRFSIEDAKGGNASSISHGGNPDGVIDIQTLAMLLSTTPVCAICDTPHGTSYTESNGIKYDADFMQGNWILARSGNIGGPVDDAHPWWTWAPQFVEAT